MNQMPPLGKEGETMGRMGRMGDNTLVHMNPQEVDGLAALGKLTYNPVTGLPEAFNFSEVIEEAVEAVEAVNGVEGVEAVEAQDAIEGETYKSLEYTALIAPMIEAIKELSAKVTALENA